MAMPPFEFYRSSQVLDESRIFFRDFAQCWYHDGLPGVSDDIYGTATYIAAQIDKLGPERVAFVGNSMGGFAAILFASLVGKGEVIAFAPQTFISPYRRFIHRDSRWKKEIRKTYRICLRKPHVWDLRALLRRLNGSQSMSVFVSRKDKLDMIHASYLSEFPNVSVFGFDYGKHAVVRHLRDEGLLAEIMTGAYRPK